MSFREQVVITILDKALIGGLLLGFGLWAARTLERFKARQTLLSKFRERRLEVVFPILLKLQEWQFQLVRYFDDMRSIHVDNLDNQEERSRLLCKRFAQYSEGELALRDEIETLLDSNRMLIGVKIVSLLEKHMDKLFSCPGKALSDKPYEFVWANGDARHRLPSLEKLLNDIERST